MLIHMEIFSSSLRIMDGLLQALKKFKKQSKRTNAPTGRTRHQPPAMHSIVVVEQFLVNAEGHLRVTAILENEERQNKGSFLFEPPAVAPIRAMTTIHKECLPVGKTFHGKSKQQLASLVDEHQLFLHQQWELAPANSESESNGRLFY